MDLNKIITILSLTISFLSLGYAARAFSLKNKIKIRGSFSPIRDFNYKDRYFGSICLENMKDRRVAIYKIYIRINYLNYLLIESFDENPLVLDSFEIFKREYSPVNYYISDLLQYKFDINKSIISKSKKEIVLSTNFGKYIVRKDISKWSPNYLSTKLIPVRFNNIKNSLSPLYNVSLQFNGQTNIFIVYQNGYTSLGNFLDKKITNKTSKQEIENILRHRYGSEISNLKVSDLRNFEKELVLTSKLQTMILITFLKIQNLMKKR